MKHKHHRWECLFKWCLSQILSRPAFVIFGLKRGKTALDDYTLYVTKDFMFQLQHNLEYKL